MACLYLQDVKIVLSNIDANNNNNGSSNCRLIHADFMEKEKHILDNNSIDLILTEPPYGFEALAIYEGLAWLADRVLKPGGSLVFFVDHVILDHVIRLFDDNNDNLKYWWIFCVKHSRNHSKVYPRNVCVEWNPMLWYVKGDKTNNLTLSNTIGDHIDAKPLPKTPDDREQSSVEAEYIIKNLTIENQTVLDPMMGLGTVGIAAFNMKRKFIGIEKDSEKFKIANARMNNGYKSSTQNYQNSFVS